MRSWTSLTTLLALTGCSGTDLRYSDEAHAGIDTGAPPTNEDAGGSESDDNAPPESENAFLALVPAQTDVYVFVANPERNTVTRVKVDDRSVRTLEVGEDPRIVLTTPDYSTAVVFNRGDDSVSILDADTLEQRVVRVRDNMNQLAISPDGRFAALWHDLDAERPDDPTPSGVQSYNEVSFVDLSTGIHYGMAVDYNPREIKFNAAGTLAAVVTDTSLGLVDLRTFPLLPTLVPVTDELLDPPVAEEVEVSPNGDYAFVRQFGATDLAVVDLSLREVYRLPCGTNPTDLDITPDGAHAIVVARGSRELWSYAVADPFADPDVLPIPSTVGLGSVLIDPTGQQAILYTTATPTDRYATWDLNTGVIQERALVKPIKSIAVTPTGDSLLVFHTKTNATEGDASSPFYNSWALTTISLPDFRQNPLKLPAEPIGFDTSNNGRLGYFIMEGEPLLEVLDFQTLLPEEIELDSEPVYVGVLPDLTFGDSNEPFAWVSQKHVLGRMTFYDPDDGSVETITGFELNSQIED